MLASQLATDDYEISRETSLEEIVRSIRKAPRDTDVSGQTEKIISEVRELGDKALLNFTNRFDGTQFDRDTDLFVSPNEIKQAYSKIKTSEVTALKQEMRQIRALSKSQLQRFEEKALDSPLGFKIRESYAPFPRIGGYIPGGLAAYPSTVLMVTVPAREAGVREILLATPPRADGSVIDPVLVAADLAGVSEILKVGGAQAIAAMALGTASVKKVSLIVGPGNDFVTEAKKQLAASGKVKIDSLAGPTELLIAADETANPALIVEDLISQAEHGNRTLCGLVSNSSTLIDSVKRILCSISNRPRLEHILKCNLFTVLGRTLNDIIEFCQYFAPEHLELLVRDSERIYRRFTSAGLVLIGNYTPCSASDYMVGTNHILPTDGTAAYFPGLGVESFLKRTTAVKGTKKSLEAAARYITALATMEGFPNHATAVGARFKKSGEEDSA